MIIIKHLRKIRRLPCDPNEKYELSYLINNSANAHAVKSLRISSSFPADIEPDINEKRSVRQMFLHYLETLSMKYPKNELIKLFLAHFYAKKLKLYGSAMKIITDLQQTGSSRTSLNASLLVYEVQSIIKKQYGNTENLIDMFLYTKNQALLAEIKDQMIQQADLQINLFHELMEDSPNLAKIFDNSQVIVRYQGDVDRKMNILTKRIPEAYIEPLALYSNYQLFLNYSFSDHLSYQKLYTKKYEKYVKQYKNDNLVPETFYQDSNVFLLVSGQRGDAGKIVFCSKAAEETFGGDPRLYIGTHLSTLSPPALQNHVSTTWKTMVEKGDRSDLNKQTQMYIYHKDGYVLEANAYMSIHPYMTKGFYFSLIVRPIYSSQDFLLVRENGDIECATQKVGIRLGLIASRNSSLTETVNVRQLSMELKRVNDAFNTVATEEKNEFVVEEVDKSQTLKGPRYYYSLSEEMDPKGDITRDITTIKTTIMERNTTNKTDMTRLSTDKAKELYNAFLTGKDIELAPIKRKDEIIETKGSLNFYSYNCTVKNLMFGTTHMKLIVLEENLNGNKEFFNEIEKEKLEFPFSQTNELITEEEKKESFMKEIDNSGFFKSEDEKHIGWIDFGALKSDGPLKSPTTLLGENLTTNEGNLLSPSNGQISFNTSLNKLRGVLKLQKVVDKTSKTTKSGNEDPRVINMMRPIAAEASLATTKWSKTSQQRKISNAFKTALAIKYYPKYFNVLWLSFYLTLFAIFATQVNLKVTLDNTISELMVKKEILSNSQLRTYNLVLNQEVFRLIWNMKSGRFSPAQLGVFVLLDGIFAQTAVSTLKSLAQTNQNLLTSTNSLDQENRAVLFRTDVAVYDTYFGETPEVVNYFNTFHSIDKLVEYGLRVSTVMMTDMNLAMTQFDFIFRNSVNDLLVKNEEISEIFLQSLNDQRDLVTSIVNIYLIISIVVLFLASILLIFIIGKQYEREKTNLIALIKLNTRKMKDTLDHIKRFKRATENEKSFEGKYGSEVLDYVKKSSKNNGMLTHAKKEHMKVPNLSGIRLKYVFLIARLVIFIAIIMGLVAMNSLIGSESISFFEGKQSQIFFTDRMTARIFVAQTASQEFLTMNDTVQVQNMKTSIAVQKTIEELSSLKVTASSIYIDEDSTYNPVIKEILFSDGCGSIGSSNAFWCTIVETTGQKTNLINLLTYMESILQLRYDEFFASDRSDAAITAIEGAHFQVLTGLGLLIAAQCTEINKILETDFDNKMEEARQERNYVLAGFSGVLFILCILGWVYVFHRLKEANNKFKRVLKTLPAHLVLSSFILKSFLIKTSKGALDFVKNDI